jgi:hypothetical protein
MIPFLPLYPAIVFPVQESAPSPPKNDFTIALQMISEKFSVAIVSDIYSAETLSFPPTDYLKSSAEASLQLLASKTRRSCEKIQGIFVLRSRAGAAARLSQNQKDYPYSWQREGTVTLSLSKGFGSLTTNFPDYKIQTNAVSLQLLSKEITKSGYNVKISPDFSSQRVVVHSAEISIPNLMIAIGYLFNATPEINLKRNRFQEVTERAQSEKLPADLVARQTFSSELMPDLLRNLSEEQIKDRQRGEFIEISLNELPSKMQDKYREYVRFSFEISSKVMTTPLGTPDWSKLDSFKIQLKPPGAPGTDILGVGVVRTDGIVIYF